MDLDSVVMVPDVGVASPPPGVQPNFINPPSRQNEMIIVEAIFTLLMLLAVLTRGYARGYILKIWKAEDSMSNLKFMDSMWIMMGFQVNWLLTAANNLVYSNVHPCGRK